MVVIPWRANLLLAALFILLHVLLLGWPLAVGHPPTGWVGGALFALYVAATFPLWALIHEAVHGRLLAAPGHNRRLGRALAVVFGGPFRVLRYGHLFHHRHNRGPADRTEIYDAARGGWLRAALAFYPRLLFGLYLGELVVSLAVFLPRRILAALVGGVSRSLPAAERRLAGVELLSSAARRELRIDGALVMVFYVALFWLWREALWLPVAAVAGRAVLVSLLDNSFHYGTPLEDRLYALNLRLPRGFSPLILNFNLHRTHHRNVGLPWNALPAATVFEAEDPPFTRALLRQLRGPLMARQLPHRQSA